MDQSEPTWLYIVIVVIAILILAKAFGYLRRRSLLIHKYGREIGLKILHGRIWQGMSSEQVIDSWGNPVGVDHEVYKTKRKETWKYGQTGKNRFRDRIYLENGIVVGWKD